MYIFFGPVVPFLGIHPADLLTHVPLTGGARVSTAALLVTVKDWESPKCLFLGGLVK